ncbi:MAG: stage III sporulation protein AG [Oscillospiraceae bacterium]|nr:stage III sporulation protein AG [Oscillospiraceae bacterium]
MKELDYKKYTEKLQSFLTEKKNWLFVAGLLGILLIFLSEIVGTDKADKVQPTSATQTTAQSASDYTLSLESRLQAIISNIEGAGNVQVMVTLENSEEYVYAQTEKSDTDVATQAGGDNTSERVSYENSYILVEGTDGKQALVQTKLEPEVKGVAVVCSGGDDIAVVKRITDVVSTVLGVSTNRICVTKMI